MRLLEQVEKFTKLKKSLVVYDFIIPYRKILVIKFKNKSMKLNT